MNGVVTLLSVGLALVGVVVSILAATVVISQRRRLGRLEQRRKALEHLATRRHPITGLLTPEQQEVILEALRTMVADAAERLNLPADHVRANIFIPVGNGYLGIAPGLTVNMQNPSELKIEIEEGWGSTGRAFASGQPTISVRGNDWGASELGQHYRGGEPDPDLKWIVSVPIKIGPNRPSLGVLNVDALHESKSPDELEPALQVAIQWSQIIIYILLSV